MPGLATCDATAVANTTVSPYEAQIEPSACRATRPVSSRRVRPATSISTVCTILGLLWLRPPDAHRERLERCGTLQPLSVFTCATDYCPLLRFLRNNETGYYFLIP